MDREKESRARDMASFLMSSIRLTGLIKSIIEAFRKDEMLLCV